MSCPKRIDNISVVLDGGLASELERLGNNISSDPLWSARLLQTNPGSIKQAHTNFLEAGADVVTTASYQANIPNLVEHMNVSPSEAMEMIKLGVQIAQDACDEYFTAVSSDEEPHDDKREKPYPVGSVGPYGACLHDGSEYTGSYIQNISTEEMITWHRARIQCLSDAGVRTVAVETIPALTEALAVITLLREFPNLTAWISFSCKDAVHVNDGGVFSDAVQAVCGADSGRQVLAVGVNCTAPHYVAPLIASHRGSLPPHLTYVAYPNSGETWCPRRKQWVEEGESVSGGTILTHAPSWPPLGVTMVGGCCRVGPAQIAALARRQTHHTAANSCWAGDER